MPHICTFSVKYAHYSKHIPLVSVTSLSLGLVSPDNLFPSFENRFCTGTWCALCPIPLQGILDSQVWNIYSSSAGKEGKKLIRLLIPHDTVYRYHYINLLFCVAGVPVKYSESLVDIRSAPPALGQHTQQVLGAELGLSETEVEGLRCQGIL